MLPYPQDTPSFSSQGACHCPVASLVIEKLPAPVDPICFRNLRVDSTPMPETAVYKNRDVLRRKDEIWAPDERLMSAPASDPMQLESTDQRQLGVFVSIRADARHDFAALSF